MIPNILVTIPTTRLDESIAFYTDVLGFAVERRLDRPGGVSLVFLVNEGFVVELVANPNLPAGEVGASAPMLTFQVKSHDEITTCLAANGISCPKAMELPGGISILRFNDPNGVLISFVAGDH